MRTIIFLVFSLCFISVCGSSNFQKGAAFGGDVATLPYDTPDAVQSLVDLKTQGANWVCIVVTWFQDNINSTFIYPVEGKSQSLSAVTSIVNNATKLGFKVFLKPHVDVLDGTWRAWIGTYFSEEDWDIWFYSYEAYYLNFAKLAQQLDVSIYSVGVEMVTASSHTSKFIKIISDVRKYYSGVVTYSANWGSKLQSVLPPTEEKFISWDGEIDNILFIDKLDIIGLDAYYYLTSELNPSLQDLLNAWAPIVSHVRNISEYWNKSVIFTEIGYRSIEGAAVHPGWWNNSATSNVTQQALCYQSVFESFMNQSWWEGIYWWSWSSDPKAGGNTDTDFTPQNKEETLSVLKKYYSIL